MRKLFLSFLMLTTVSLNAQTYLDSQAPIEERIKDALSRMTLHEKVKMLHAQSKFTSAGVPRLGIRQLNMDDGPHGVREELVWDDWRPAGQTNDFCVAFPSLTCLAATWNRDLSRLYGISISEEFAYRGKDVMLGPGVNIARTPLNGRAFEYMGEDPLLAGEMVVPYIQAVQENGVACCLKHFVLNDQETDRFSVNVNISERAMREIYLAPFQRAVEKAHVYSIMGSYNLWHNVHCSQSDELLNGILKKEWGWDGCLVSDWDAVTDSWQAATGGLDIEMGTSHNGSLHGAEFTYDDYHLGNDFEKFVQEGKVPMSVLDEKVSRVLRLIFRTAMNPNKIIGNQCSEAHYDACRQIGEEGIVLLKNNKQGKAALLPLDFSKYKNILVVGENATRSLTLGGGSSELKTLRDISPLEALQTAVAAANSHLSPVNCQLSYAQGYASGKALYDKKDAVDAAESQRLKEEALSKAADADLIIFIGGLNKNHRQDCENGDREGYDLSYGQNELISQLSSLNSNLIVVTFGGNPYATPWLSKVPALIHCWYLGSEAGTALVNVLSGKVCPSGKLPVTFAKQYEDYPYVKYGKEAYPGVDKQVYYKEDVFVGYRGFEKDKKTPLFPFGFGLSYTTFSYDDVKVAKDTDGNISVDVTVTNTGSCAGKEVVQGYVSAPNNKEIIKPLKELKAFAKTNLLQPNQQQTLHTPITPQDLASWNEATHQWQTDNGEYTIHVGTSSANIVKKVKCNV